MITPEQQATLNRMFEREVRLNLTADPPISQETAEFYATVYVEQRRLEFERLNAKREKRKTHEASPVCPHCGERGPWPETDGRAPFCSKGHQQQ